MHTKIRIRTLLGVWVCLLWSLGAICRLWRSAGAFMGRRPEAAFCWRRGDEVCVARLLCVCVCVCVCQWRSRASEGPAGAQRTPLLGSRRQNLGFIHGPGWGWRWGWGAHCISFHWVQYVLVTSLSLSLSPSWKEITWPAVSLLARPPNTTGKIY